MPSDTVDDDDDIVGGDFALIHVPRVRRYPATITRSDFLLEDKHESFRMKTTNALHYRVEYD